MEDKVKIALLAGAIAVALAIILFFALRNRSGQDTASGPPQQMKAGARSHRRATP